jgi:hypothetical protein
VNCILKVLPIDLPGEPDHFQALWPFAEGLFYLKKKDF